MEVACNQCGAKYQFDASAIPPEGYDAQCTNCGSVFFVSAAAVETPPISVSCVHCGAVYQFPASAIPPEGYDAQCTQCNNVFFVSTQGAAATAAVAQASPAPAILPTAAQAPADPLPAPSQPAIAPVETPVVLATKKPMATSEPVVATPKVKAPAPTPTASPDDDLPEDAADMMRLANELGEPSAVPGGSTEDDFERIMGRRKKRLTVVGALLGAVVGYCVLTYVAIPRLFDMTVGRLVGIKLTVNPDAVPLMEKGRADMLLDTDAGYTNALKDLEASLTIDADYPDAIALAALCHIFRGGDIQAQGREIFDAGARASAEIKAYDEVPLTKRPADAAKHIEELRAQAAHSATESAKLFEAGGNEVSAALTLLRPAINKFKSSPVISAAAGIYYTTDVDSLARAQEMLRMAIELRTGANTTLDLANPPDVWTPLLQGLVKGASRGGDDDARAAFTAALKKEPKLARAKFELLKVFDRQAKRDDAKKLATEILADSPTHAKARAYLARKVEPPPTSSPPKDDKAPTDVPAKGKKAKTKRKR